MGFVTLNIEDREYRILPMSPAKGSGFCARVASLLSQAFNAGAVGLSEVLPELKSVDVKNPDAFSPELQAKLMRMVMGILPHIDPDKFTDLCHEALNYECFAGGTKLSDQSHFNKWFTEHQGDYFPVAIWAIRCHAAGFFTNAGASFAAMVKAPTR